MIKLIYYIFLTHRKSGTCSHSSDISDADINGRFHGYKGKTRQDTLGILETIVEGKANFEKWGNFDDIEIMYDWSGKTSDAFKPDMNNAEYVAALKSAMQNRVDAVKGFAEKNSGYDKLPDEALVAVQKLVDALS